MLHKRFARMAPKQKPLLVTGILSWLLRCVFWYYMYAKKWLPIFRLLVVMDHVKFLYISMVLYKVRPVEQINLFCFFVLFSILGFQPRDKAAMSVVN